MSDKKDQEYSNAGLSGPGAPERIYGWRDSQLSIARHYGGIKYMGASYVIDMTDIDQPLVRQDVLQAEAKARKDAAKAKKSIQQANQVGLWTE